MYKYLRSLFIKPQDITPQDWQELHTTVQVELDNLRLKLVALDGLFYEPLTRESMSAIDLICGEIGKNIRTIQQTAIQLKNCPPKDDDDRILKNTKVFEIALELQKISNVYRTKQHDYLCKTTMF